MKKFLSIVLVISLIFTINTFSVLAYDISVEQKISRLISIGFPERFFETKDDYMINSLYEQYHDKIIECTSTETAFLSENQDLNNQSTRAITSDELRFVVSTFTSLGGYPDTQVPPYQITEVIVFIEYTWAEGKPLLTWDDAISVNWNSDVFTLREGSFNGYDHKKLINGETFTVRNLTNFDFGTQNGLGYTVQLGYVGNGTIIRQHYGLSYFILVPATPLMYTVPDNLLSQAYTTSIVANYVHNTTPIGGSLSFSVNSIGDVTIDCSGFSESVGTNTTYYYSREPLS